MWEPHLWPFLPSGRNCNLATRPCGFKLIELTTCVHMKQSLNSMRTLPTLCVCKICSMIPTTMSCKRQAQAECAGNVAVGELLLFCANHAQEMFWGSSPFDPKTTAESECQCSNVTWNMLVLGRDVGVFCTALVAQTLVLAQATTASISLRQACMGCQVFYLKNDAL